MQNIELVNVKYGMFLLLGVFNTHGLEGKVVEFFLQKKYFGHKGSKALRKKLCFFYSLCLGAFVAISIFAAKRQKIYSTNTNKKSCLIKTALQI
jgi:hypothetical protein